MRTWTASLAACTLALLSSGVIAAGLLDAYQAARQNDPTFKAARYERDAGQYAIDIGRAGLLPSISLNGAYLRNTGEQTSTVFTSVTQSLDYTSKYTVLGLRQPLFNYDSFVRYQQGSVQVAYSDAVFDKKEAELAVRVAGAYLDTLYAADQLALADAEIAAYRAQRELAERRRKGGEGTITDVAEAESRLQLARAGRADTVDRFTVALRKLEGMTGKAMAPLWTLRPGFMPTAAQTGTLDQWSALAQDNNPEIRSRRKAYELASLEVDRNRAGHMPQVDFVARGTRARSDTLSTRNQEYYTNAVGVEFNFPLFAGGRVNALTGQAIANRERARAELDGAVTDTLVELERQFLAVETGNSRVAAYRNAVDASVVTAEGMRRGMAAGIRTNTDVLDAERQMFIAERDLAQARYAYLISTLQLKTAAGVLSEKDVAEVATLLVPRE